MAPGDRPLDWPLNWIEELAKAELGLQEKGEVDPFGHLNEEKILKDHTFSFLKELRTLFQTYATSFNEARQDTRQTIKVYGIAQTEADFLVFRNNLKLVVTFVKAGQIEISFHALSGGLFTPNKKVPPLTKTGIPRPPGKFEDSSGDVFDLELGPFNESTWFFNGTHVEPPSLVRFYLTEFIKNSTS